MDGAGCDLESTRRPVPEKLLHRFMMPPDSDPAVTSWLVPRLGEVLDVVEDWFDPRWAEPWDAVGLVCGDRDERVERILLAIDPVPATITEAIDRRAQLLLTHHPLLLTGVHGVPADDPKGAMVHRMIRAGVAHYVAHTNADVADPGVSDALASRLALSELRPLDPAAGEPLDKLVVFAPVAAAQQLIDALASSGAGRIGAYDRCAWTAEGQGTFRPDATANPAIGQTGEITVVAETRVEMVLPRRIRGQVIAALMRAHPYEQPAFDLLPMAELPSTRGIGRVGQLAEPTTLRTLLERAARALPTTVWGLRAAGAPDQLVRTVAVCGGSGASLIERARAAGADAYLTADLKHHTVLEAVSERDRHPVSDPVSDPDRPMALIDAAHWATEAPWLDELAMRLREHFGTTVDVVVSQRATDPWSLHAPSVESNESSPSRQ
jgi:dinuclear metal center YbgI/SA1388 family protein